MQQWWFIEKSKLDQHVLGNNSAHLQEHLTVQYSLWYDAPSKLTIGGLVTEGTPPITRPPIGNLLGASYHKLYYTV
jgi:hypothetical protein